MWTYSASSTVVAGQYTNVGKVTGSVSATGQSVSDTDPANYFRFGTALNIEKLINGQDADSTTGPILSAGGTATFTYQVTNTGNIAVGSIAVVDDNGTSGNTADDFNPTFTGGDTNSNGLLDLGETWTYGANRTVVAGQYTNIGKVTATVSATGQSVSDTDPANYFRAFRAQYRETDQRPGRRFSDWPGPRRRRHRDVYLPSREHRQHRRWQHRGR